MESENSKRIAKNSMMLFIRMMFTMLVSLYTSRLVLELLGIENFGIYNVVGGIVVMFAFLNQSLGSATQRFITYELGKNNLDKLKKVFSISLIVHVGIALIILLLAETIGLWFLNNKLNIPSDRMYAAHWVYQLSVFTSLLTIIQVPYNATIIAHENMSVYAYVSIVEVSLKLLLVYLLYVSNYDKLIVYALLVFLVSLIVISIYKIYCRMKYPESKFSFIWDKDLIKLMLNFSGWNIVGVLAFNGANQGINILLNIFFGPAVNAARAVSYQVNYALNGFVNSFQTAVSPQIIKLYAQNEINQLHNLLYKNSKYAFFLLFLFVLPLMFELEFVLSFWLKIVPKNTAVFTRIVIIQSLFYCMSRPFIIAMHAVGKMKHINLTGSLVLLMILPISYLLLVNGSPVYVPFVVYVIATIIEFFFYIFFLKKYINISYKFFFKKIVLPVIYVLATSIPLPFVIFLSMENGLHRFLLIGLTSFVVSIVSVYLLGIENDDKLHVLNYIKKIIIKN